MYVFVYLFVYVCMHTDMCIHICIYIYIYMYTHILSTTMLLSAAHVVMLLASGQSLKCRLLKLLLDRPMNDEMRRSPSARFPSAACAAGVAGSSSHRCPWPT